MLGQFKPNFKIHLLNIFINVGWNLMVLIPCYICFRLLALKSVNWSNTRELQSTKTILLQGKNQLKLFSQIQGESGGTAEAS
jgi:hypothetical protein